jgi:ribonuclease P protein component
VPIRKLNAQTSKRKAYPRRFSLTKADRILLRREFIALSKSGRRIQNDHFIAYFSPNQHGRSRLGVTVTKKVGPAVKRNRIKRLVREYFRLNRHRLAGNWDINIIAKRKITDFFSEAADRSLMNIFERIMSHNDNQ